MQKEYYVNHPSDRDDAFSEIKDFRIPYLFYVKSTAPKKIHEDEYQKKKRQMAYFFRSICPSYATCAGVTEEQARYELLCKFGRVGEAITDDSGAFDVVWLEEDRMRVMEQGKKYIVQSVADMSNSRLAELIENSKNYVLIQYGVAVREFINNNKTKEV